MLGRTSVRSLVSLALIALMAIAVGLWSQNTANADPQCTGPSCSVGDTAIVGGGSGSLITVECKWELPDASPLDAAMTYGMDDTPLVFPTSECQKGVADVDGKENTMGILPNQGDFAADGVTHLERQYEKWVAVQTANVSDILDVYWDVWEPYVAGPPNGPNCAPGDAKYAVFNVNGVATAFCHKYQHYAAPDINNPASSTNPLIEISDHANNCGDLQNPPLSNMLQAAVDNGQMSSDERDDMIDHCFQGSKAIFRVRETISKDQPAGEYRVQVSIVPGHGTTVRDVNFFDVVPFIYINKDFTLVNWQNISNGGSYTVEGDMDMQSPAGEAKADGSGVKPTIENTGNEPMYVWTHFNPLITGTGGTSKQITRFDSKFRAVWQTNPGSRQVFDPQYASTWVCYDQHPLGSDQTGKLDLSVEPESAEPGTYNGSVNVFGGTDCVTHP